MKFKMELLGMTKIRMQVTTDSVCTEHLIGYATECGQKAFAKTYAPINSRTVEYKDQKL